MVTDPYDAFAADYHWIFPDDHLSGRLFADRYGHLLRGLPPASEVLDCACGIGIEALALARAGHRVSATDQSAGMVVQARAASEQAGERISVARCSWEELPGSFGSVFDAAFCLGNSIAHCRDAEATIRSLAGMAAVLRPGGLLVLESRDWEQLRAGRPRIELRGPSSVRHGERGFSLYVWTIPERWDERHVAEIVVVVERAGEVRHRRVELAFVPYRRDELLDRVAKAGLGSVEASPNHGGRYVVTARR